MEVRGGGSWRFGSWRFGVQRGSWAWVSSPVRGVQVLGLCSFVCGCVCIVGGLFVRAARGEELIRGASAVVSVEAASSGGRSRSAVEVLGGFWRFVEVRGGSGWKFVEVRVVEVRGSAWTLGVGVGWSAAPSGPVGFARRAGGVHVWWPALYVCCVWGGGRCCFGVDLGSRRGGVVGGRWLLRSDPEVFCRVLRTPQPRWPSPSWWGVVSLCCCGVDLGGQTGGVAGMSGRWLLQRDPEVFHRVPRLPRPRWPPSSW